jgi:signal transduction histidine kinase
MRGSVRTRFLLVQLFGVVLPLAIIGLWLAQSTRRTGEALLRSRLDTGLSQIAEQVGIRWVGQRSALLTAADGDGLPPEGAWHGSATPEHELFTVVLPVHSRRTGERIAELAAPVAVSDLLPAGLTTAVGVGAVLGVIDPATGRSLLSIPFDPEYLHAHAFIWAGEHWLVARRELTEPRLTIALAAPLTPYSAPFERAAHDGAVALVLVALAALLAAVLLTRRITAGLTDLARAADDIARGDLDRSLPVTSDDEVGRLARAFNAMTSSLRSTLAELAQRRSLAAVGQFAASLAHEVRNPLTSIQVDLQRVRGKVRHVEGVAVPLDRALREVARLDRTVSGALEMARSGAVRLAPVDLRLPAGRAAEVARPAFARAGAVLEELPRFEGPVMVHGDASALQQLLLNLLLNAAQALPPAGRAGITLAPDAGGVTVSVWDTGPGVPREARRQLFEPFFSTKPGGTGLGLAIAQQIAVAHGTRIELGPETGHGTTFRFRLRPGGGSAPATLAGALPPV